MNCGVFGPTLVFVSWKRYSWEADGIVVGVGLSQIKLMLLCGPAAAAF